MLPSPKTQASKLSHHLVDDRVYVKAICLVDLDIYALVLTSVCHIVIGYVYHLCKDV